MEDTSHLRTRKHRASRKSAARDALKTNDIKPLTASKGWLVLEYIWAEKYKITGEAVSANEVAATFLEELKELINEKGMCV